MKINPTEPSSSFSFSKIFLHFLVLRLAFVPIITEQNIDLLIVHANESSDHFAVLFIFKY